jgi:hypothetical protein
MTARDGAAQWRGDVESGSATIRCGLSRTRQIS